MSNARKHDHETSATLRGNDLHIGTVITVAMVGIVLIFASIVAITSWFYSEAEVERQTKSLAQSNPWLQDLQIQQEKKITIYRWVNQARGVAAIPITRAMELEIQERKKEESR